MRCENNQATSALQCIYIYMFFFVFERRKRTLGKVKERALAAPVIPYMGAGSLIMLGSHFLNPERFSYDHGIFDAGKYGPVRLRGHPRPHPLTLPIRGGGKRCVHSSLLMK